MATTYRKNKLEKFQKTLEQQLKGMESNLKALKAEGIEAGYISLLMKYNLLYNVALDFALEFDLELPIYPPDDLLFHRYEEKNQTRRDTMEKINTLMDEGAFVSPDSKELADYANLFEVIDMEEFFLQCNLNPTLSYSQAVHRSCRQATMYFLYVVANKLHAGKYKLSNIRVVDGIVGTTPHTWLQLGEEYYFDMTLAQFTTREIPKLAVLPIKKATGIYEVRHVIPWTEWVKLESDMIERN